MNLTDRDRRILLFLLPVMIVVGYWFLLLSPKRDDLTTARDEQTQAEARRDAAEQRVAQLDAARQTFASDYAAVVRLGKAIPATVDAPSLLLQLDQASRGTGIDFRSVSFGSRTTAAIPGAAPAPAAPGGAAAPGGEPAQTAPGQVAEGAGENVTDANAQSAQAQGAAEGTPGADATGQAAPSQAPPATLDAVPLTFTFTGTYFDLADFFHRLKRFVRITTDGVIVPSGRLLTIDSLSFGGQAGGGEGGELKAGALITNVTATVYLSPRTQGVTAGATPAAPAATPPAGETARRGSPAPTATAVPVR